MKESLRSAMKEAMKSKDRVRLDTIRGLLSEIQYEEMQKGVEDLDAASVTQVLQREKKKRAEEIEFAEKANRPDSISQFKLELSVIESFLPQQLSDSELERIVVELKNSDPALTVGACMTALKERYAGQYDGKTASAVVKRLLAN